MCSVRVRRGLTDEQWKAEKKLRASVGLGVSWISPLGPLRLAYAFPIKSQKEVTDPEHRVHHHPEG
jgi:outer membrane protein insertion porin family